MEWLYALVGFMVGLAVPLLWFHRKEVKLTQQFAAQYEQLTGKIRELEREASVRLARTNARLDVFYAAAVAGFLDIEKVRKIRDLQLDAKPTREAADRIVQMLLKISEEDELSYESDTIN